MCEPVLRKNFTGEFLPLESLNNSVDSMRSLLEPRNPGSIPSLTYRKTFPSGLISWYKAANPKVEGLTKGRPDGVRTGNFVPPRPLSVS